MLIKILAALGLTLTIVLSLGLLTEARAAAERSDAEAIQATWRPSAAELAGKPYPENVRKSIKLVIKDDTYAVTVGEAPPDRGTIKLDPAATPKTINITGTEGPNKGKTFLAIYELNGDTLRICYDLSGKSRPKEFKTEPNTMLFLVTYEREK